MGQSITSAIRENVEKVIVGKTDMIDLLLAAIAAGGNVLIEDLPGTGKTMLARALAKSMDFSFGRIQFTPDLLPSDVTGLSYYDQSVSRFVFREGPVFTNLLLADEINRATPRTQSALLECMEEKSVTVDGETRKLKAPFFVIATQNPVETLGTYPLPEAQLDRFMMKLHIGNLSSREERSIVDRLISRDNSSVLNDLSPAATLEQVLEIQKQAMNVRVHDELRDYIVALCQASRTLGGQSHAAYLQPGGISPRGTISLVRASQGYALVMGRDYVVPEDIKAVAVPVLAHRLICDEDESVRISRINDLLSKTPVPTEDWSRL